MVIKRTGMNGWIPADASSEKNVLYTYVIHRKYIQFVGERKIVKSTGHYESAYKNESLKEKNED